MPPRRTALWRLLVVTSCMAGDWWAGIEMRHLVALDAVAREGSFRRAATRLGYVQSAISHQIAALEGLIGKRLIDRSRGTRPLALTPAGEILLAHADALIARVRAAQADLAALHGEGVAAPRVSEELARLPLIAHAPTREHVEEQLRVHGVEPRFVLEAGTGAAVQGLVAAGLGAALLPRLATEERWPETVVLELEPGMIAGRTIAVVWSRMQPPRADAA